MVMGGDSRYEGHGFESWHRILDGHFFTYYCCKNCNVCLKRPKINEIEAGVGPFFLKKTTNKNPFLKQFLDSQSLQPEALPKGQMRPGLHLVNKILTFIPNWKNAYELTNSILSLKYSNEKSCSFYR